MLRKWITRRREKNKTENLYDIRAVRLQKTTRNNTLETFLEGVKESESKDESKNAFICLGHFDTMIIEELSYDGTQSPLTIVQKDSQNPQNQQEHYEDNYAYPLYILKQIEKAERDAIDQFWAEKSLFLLVTRLHCDRVENEQKPFVELLKDHCINCKGDDQPIQKPRDENGVLQFDVSPCGQEEGVCVSVPVSAILYNSLELGDVVGVIKSKSLTAAMELQRYLFTCKHVRDTYTYCGVDASWLGTKNDEAFEKKLEEWKKDVDSIRLGCVSTRFSVKNADKAEEFYEKHLKAYSAPLFITGNADAIIDRQPCAEYDFLKQLRQIARSSGDFYQAFHDVITRVGISHRNMKGTRSGQPERKHFLTRMAIDPALEITLRDVNAPYPWRYALVKLLGTLQAMYNNSVMDDLSDLLIPGVKALLERMDYLLKNGLWNIGYDHDAEALEFLDKWSLLVSDISNLESQLSQHPELTPVRYFIPAMVLQFELNYIKCCSEFIQKADEKAAPQETDAVRSSRAFAPILFPYSEMNPSTLCLLDPHTDSDYFGVSPLCIYLPISRLYQPWEILHSLCHEAAHYCGDNLRYREERLDCLIKCSAEYLLGLWDASLSFDSEIDYRDTLAQRIRENYRSQVGYKPAYLRIVTRELPKAIRAVALKKSSLQEYEHLFLAGLDPVVQLQYVQRINALDAMETGYLLGALCSAHVEQYLTYLCKECYADIIMVLLLDCSFAEYYSCIFGDECARLLGQNPPPPDFNEVCQRNADRIALVSIVMDELKQGNWLPRSDKLEKKQGQNNEWAKKAIEMVSRWNEQKADHVKNVRWDRPYFQAKKDGRDRKSVV